MRPGSRRLETVLQHLAPGEASPCNGELLSDQVAVVTGSGQGIGREAALLFARQGAAVVVTDLDGQKSDSVAAEIRAAGGRAVSIAGDVTDVDYADRVLGGAVKEFGKVTVLVNNAGYTWDAVIHKTTDEQWARMLEVHTTAVFRLLRACGQYMREPAKKALS